MSAWRRHGQIGIGQKRKGAQAIACTPFPITFAPGPACAGPARNGLLGRFVRGRVSTSGLVGSGFGGVSGSSGVVGGFFGRSGGVAGNRLNRGRLFNDCFFSRSFFGSIAASGEGEQSGGREGSQNDLLHISFS